ncbi:diaminopimelate epimerase [Bordetella sp. J329]|jgi:diaminopimelate epimerase|uniref:Diaminopimelate epimerase n=2 Tax=Kerstersia gyiorum TaxID=206506 RepID=A0A171KWP2_9BURK|nr:diaminopimelate epimerase [Bordetella sp. J329]KKO73309.1 diaminopimelate epimerase [Kerstersia gyiorum]
MENEVMSKLWKFSKMHGAGNDFVVLDGVRATLDITPERIRALADRHRGVGADQVLVVEPASRADADFRYRIFNADGSEVEHCGNGARCFVRYVHEHGLSARNPLRAEICTGVILLEEGPDGEVTVNMGSTSFLPGSLPFDASGLATRQSGEDTQWQLPLSAPGLPQGWQQPWLSVVSVSNPHTVLRVEDVETAPVEQLGPVLESHPRFARRVNVGFLQVTGPHEARLRVYERGAGETLACGSGACAAVVTGIRQGDLISPVRVQTRGGVLTIAWDGQQLRMTGPAVTVYHGEIDIDRLVAQQLPAGC